MQIQISLFIQMLTFALILIIMIADLRHSRLQLEPLTMPTHGHEVKEPFYMTLCPQERSKSPGFIAI